LTLGVCLYEELSDVEAKRFCVQLWDRLLKSLVRDVFKDNMDTAFDHLASGKGGKVSYL